MFNTKAFIIFASLNKEFMATTGEKSTIRAVFKTVFDSKIF